MIGAALLAAALAGAPDAGPADAGFDAFVSRPDFVKPQLVEQPAFPWTAESLNFEVSGLLLVRCGVSDQGRAHDCEVLKPLEHVRSDDVIAWVQSWRFRPATLAGKPVDLKAYVVPIRLKQPQRRPPELPLPIRK